MKDNTKITISAIVSATIIGCLLLLIEAGKFKPDEVVRVDTVREIQVVKVPEPHPVPVLPPANGVETNPSVPEAPSRPISEVYNASKCPGILHLGSDGKKIAVSHLNWDGDGSSLREVDTGMTFDGTQDGEVESFRSCRGDVKHFSPPYPKGTLILHPEIEDND